jgi:hypothetical protein
VLLLLTCAILPLRFPLVEQKPAGSIPPEKLVEQIEATAQQKTPQAVTKNNRQSNGI